MYWATLYIAPASIWEAVPVYRTAATRLFHRFVVTMGEPCASGSATKPNHIPMLEERVDTLSNQVILLLISETLPTNQLRWQCLMMRLIVFYHQERRKNERKLKKERCTYLSLHCCGKGGWLTHQSPASGLSPSSTDIWCPSSLATSFLSFSLIIWTLWL